MDLLVTGFEVNDDFTDGTFKIPLFYVSCVRDTVCESFPSIYCSPRHGYKRRQPPLRSTLYFPSECAHHVWRIASIASTSFSTLTLAFLTSAFFYSCSTWQQLGTNWDILAMTFDAPCRFFLIIAYPFCASRDFGI